MTSSRSRTDDPLSQIGWADRRGWRSAERRVRRDHDTEQLDALIGLAFDGRGVTGLTTPPDDVLLSRLTTPVEMIIAGRRLRGGRVCRRSLAKLRDGLASIASVPLTRVHRYGPYWVLTFRLATEQLVLLVEQLTLLPEWGGPGGREWIPGSAPRVGAGV